MCFFSACSTVALSAASNGRLAPSRLASCRVAQARSLSESLGVNRLLPAAAGWPPSICTSKRRQAPPAQVGERCALAVGLHMPDLDFAAGIRGFIAIAIHQASRVTRRISSGAVAPLRTQRSPSSRMLNIPARRAARRKSCSPAP